MYDPRVLDYCQLKFDFSKNFPDCCMPDITCRENTAGKPNLTGRNNKHPSTGGFL